MKKNYKVDLKKGIASCLVDRWTSLYSFVSVIVIFYFFELGNYVLPVIIFLIMIFLTHHKKVFFLGAIAHLLKMLVLYFLVLSVTEQRTPLSSLGMVLFTEIVPLGIDGLGSAHFVAGLLISPDAMVAYTTFYLGKILFKVCSFQMLFSTSL